METPQRKTCRKCRKRKVHKLFAANKFTKDKLSSWCKRCHSIASTASRKNSRQAAIEAKA